MNSDLIKSYQINRSIIIYQITQFNMYSSVASSINQSQTNIDQSLTHLHIYQALNKEYVKNGFTYKSNQILYKTSQAHVKIYPYLLLLAVTKIYHMNQFETIFFTHILNEPSARKTFDHDHQNIFGLQGLQFPLEVQHMINEVYEEHKLESGKGIAEEILKEQDQFNNEDNIDDNTTLTLDDLKKTYLYLLVIGYAIKYYLNEPTKVKPYEEYANKHIENFIPSVFNKWARNHGNTALFTTPKKINAYYMGLGFLEGEEEMNNEQQGEDCQYRNYNEIVEQLIKATMTEGDQQPLINGEEPEHE